LNRNDAHQWLEALLISGINLPNPKMEIGYNSTVEAL
jgi:hypothetical protein